MEASGPGRSGARPGAGPGPAGRRRRHADLRRAGLADRVRDLLAGHPRAAPVQPSRPGPCSCGPSSSAWWPRCSAPPSGWWAWPSSPWSSARMLVLTPVVGLGVAGLAIAFAEGTGTELTEVLFSGQSALPDPGAPRRRLDGRGTGAAGGVQVGRLRALAVRLPGRPGVPVHVHRGRRRRGRLPPPRHVVGPGGGHGHRGHGHGHAQAAR